MNPDPRTEVLLEVSQGQLIHSALFLLRGLPQTCIGIQKPHVLSSLQIFQA